ncbi:MAG: C1 family peptidase [Bacteroidota bacterium]
MPIRMEEDPRNEGRNNNNRGGGGGGGLAKLLPLIFLFVFKKPKIAIPILAIAAVWYFFFGGKEMFNGGENLNYQDTQNYQGDYTFGATLDDQKYRETEIFEPLAYGSDGTPTRYSLEKFAPRRLNQGPQGSCVGWASAYAARTILHAQSTGQNPNSAAFSPSFLYNYIALPNSNCQGSYLPDAMQFMKQNGALPLQTFPYDPSTCRIGATDQQKNQASQFRTRGYQRLTLSRSQRSPDIRAIRQYIAKGGPVVIGMEVGGTFMTPMEGQRMWYPTRNDYARRGYGGHAMCVIGYDDNMEGGAFQIMNSWGPQWGENGIAWVRYKDFQEFVMEAYGLYPMGNYVEQNKDQLGVRFALVTNEGQQQIPLNYQGGNFFRTQQPLRKGTRFKIAVDNTTECYTYVFGMETDGSSYVLFPYTSKHSPYCGLTGVRLFPRDFSMVPDDVGSSDVLAVVVSKRALDFNQLNSAINGARGGNYAEKLNNALGGRLIQGVQYQGGNSVSFDGKINGQRDAVAIVMAIDKR